MPRPWEPDYKPLSAAEAFDPKAPLPESALSALDYINRKDDALKAAEARVAELEATLRRVLRELELSPTLRRDVAPIADAIRVSRNALKGKGND